MWEASWGAKDNRSVPFFQYSGGESNGLGYDQDLQRKLEGPQTLRRVRRLSFGAPDLRRAFGSRGLRVIIVPASSLKHLRHKIARTARSSVRCTLARTRVASHETWKRSRTSQPLTGTSTSRPSFT